MIRAFTWLKFTTTKCWPEVFTSFCITAGIFHGFLGKSKLFYQASFNGDIITEIPTSAVTTYSVVKHEEPFRIMCIAGSSPKIDVSLNFMYKDQQLSLY